MYKTILIPTDFSKPADQAARWGIQLAQKFRSRLLLLHVIEDPLMYLPVLESFTLPTREQVETYIEERMENWIPEQDRGDLDIQLFWTHGRPFEEIVTFSNRRKVDLILMGTHGRGMVAHLVLGSVAENVVRKARCPVLTIHADGHQFVRP